MHRIPQPFTSGLRCLKLCFYVHTGITSVQLLRCPADIHFLQQRCSVVSDTVHLVDWLDCMILSLVILPDAVQQSSWVTQGIGEDHSGSSSSLWSFHGLCLFILNQSVQLCQNQNVQSVQSSQAAQLKKSLFQSKGCHPLSALDQLMRDKAFILANILSPLCYGLNRLSPQPHQFICRSPNP